MAYSVIALALGSLIAATPVLAAGQSVKKADAEQLVATAASSAGTSAIDGKAGGQSPEKKYCLKEALSGSHIATKECRTKKEWALEGIDIEEELKNSRK